MNSLLLVMFAGACLIPTILAAEPALAVKLSPRTDPLSRRRPIVGAKGPLVSAKLSIEGQAVDEDGGPVRHAHLVVADFVGKDEIVGATVTDDEGQFRFEDIAARFSIRDGRVADGDVQIFGEAEGRSFAWTEHLLIELILDEQNQTTGRAQLTSEDAVVLRFGAPRSLRGSVVDTAGKAVPGAKVSIVRGDPLANPLPNDRSDDLAMLTSDFEPLVRSTDERGDFDFDAVASEVIYTLSIRARPGELVNGLPAVQSVQVVVSENPAAAKRLQVSRGGEINPNPMAHGVVEIVVPE